MGNSYQLSSYRPPLDEQALQKKTHLQFRHNLKDALLHTSIQPHKQNSSKEKKGTIDIIWRPVKEHQHIKLWQKQPYCSACLKARRTTATPHQGARKPLTDLSTNTTIKSREDSRGWQRRKRPSKTNWSYSVCRIPFYMHAQY